MQALVSGFGFGHRVLISTVVACLQAQLATRKAAADGLEERIIAKEVSELEN
jgi:hypothetical protein